MTDRCELLCLDLPQAEQLRMTRLATDVASEAAQRASSFGDPTRLTLAAALREGGELCVCDLAWISERSQNLVSHHLRSLRKAELVSARREGKMVIYRLTETGAALVDAVLSGAVASR